MHHHPEGVAVSLKDMKAKFALPDGQSIEEESEAGQVMWTEAGQHLPQKMTDQAFQVILVELKGQSPGGE